MKKILGIYYASNFDEESFYNGCGGAETWAIQLAKEFARRNYHVIIFCACNKWFIYNSGVEYVDLSLYLERIQYQQFDYFIFTRALDKAYFDFIEHNDCRNIYVQSHDMFIWEGGIYQNKYIYNDDYDIKKYIALTDFHKEELHEYNSIPYENIAVIGNGLDSDVFSNINQNEIQRDNAILFSTSFGRGGDILVNGILPIVKERIPDFEVHICGYGDTVPDEIKMNLDVRFLGTLNKEDYYREFMKHKCWFLPCVVPEDFGICAAEAAMCRCDVISTFKHGMKDVCYPFVNLKMDNEFRVVETDDYHFSRYVFNMTEYEIRNACQEAATKIIDSIENYDNPERKKLRESFKNFIEKTYTWSNIVDKWETMFKLNES